VRVGFGIWYCMRKVTDGGFNLLETDRQTVGWSVAICEVLQILWNVW
jgi:hypothetical protein